ncbi:hypothetical protein F4604DRAFT_1912963 [Suillus subluteus]|nr:hypothetical protein F4604DRAFT_1912963 [Suillus subluteus]
MLPEVLEAGAVQGSIQSAHSGSRPPSVTGLGTGSIGHARSPLGFTHTYKPSNGTGSQSQTAVYAAAELIPALLVANPTVLTPIRTKRLKVYATKVAGDLGVSEEELHDFIDKVELTLLKELLDSKDFKVYCSCPIVWRHKLIKQNAVWTPEPSHCVHAVTQHHQHMFTDAHPHVMDFIRDHHNVFKIPVAMLEDVELNAQLSKLVSDLLSSIRGNIKAKNADNSGNGGSQQEDEDENVRDEGAEDESQGGEDLPTVGEENSGFKSKGRHTFYSSTKFWKFVDDSLEGICKLAKIQVAEQG